MNNLRTIQFMVVYQVEVRIRLWLYPNYTLEVTMNSDFKVTLLGTGHPSPRLDRFGPSTLIEAAGHKLLFDCGRGTMQRAFQIHKQTQDCARALSQ